MEPGFERGYRTTRERLTMNKIIIAVAIVGVTLVGCSSQASPAPTVTVTQNAPQPEPLNTDDGVSNISNDELYLVAIKSMDNPILNLATDKELLDMGYSVCEALNSGFTTDDVIAYMATQMADNGMTSDAEVEAVGYIIGAADNALCPGANSF